jgi:hypothetical protein
MSVINYRRSVNGQNDQLGRKYLSDITYGPLSCWWGRWDSYTPANMSIAYDNLPPEPGVLSRIHFTSLTANQIVALQFNVPQNLNNYALEWWWRRTVGWPIAIYCALNTATAPLAWYNGPTTSTSLTDVTLAWTKSTININGTRPVHHPREVNPSAVWSKTKTLLWVAINNNGDIDIAGVNLRRL